MNNLSTINEHDLKKTLVYFIVLMFIIVITNYSVNAANLEAPAEKKVTIKSEIERGRSMVSNIKHDHSKGLFPFIDAVDKVVQLNKEKNTDTQAFCLGVYFLAWQYLNININVAKQYPEFHTPREIQLSEETAKLYFEEFRKIQKELKIDDDTLIAVTKANREVVVPLLYRYEKKR